MTVSPDSPLGAPSPAGVVLIPLLLALPFAGVLAVAVLLNWGR